jgi:hypothetical protein
MLLIIPVSIYFFLVVFTAGLLMRRLFKLPIESSNQEISALCGLDVGATAGLGLSLLIPLVSLISIFHPIDSWVHFSIVGALILIVGPRHIAAGLSAAFKNDEWYRNKILLFFAVGSYCWFAFVSAGGSRDMLDTPAYHMATVKWVREFGVVSGLTNLMDRLGANSSWHVFAAFLEPGPLAGKSTHFAGLLVYMILIAICLPGFAAILKNKAGLAEIFQSLGLPVLLLGSEWLITSLSTDWPMYVVLFLAFLICLKILVSNDSEPDRLEGGLIGAVSALAALSVSIKLTAAPYVLLPLSAILMTRKRFLWNCYKALLIGFLVVSPFLARNVILSGYLVYPSVFPDVFQFDWKVPKDDVLGLYNWAKDWAYYSANLVQIDVRPLTQMGLFEKINIWYDTWVTQNMSGNQCRDLFFMFAISVFASAVVFFQFRKKPNLSCLQGYIVLVPIPLLGLFYGFISAPVPRYLWIHFAMLCLICSTFAIFLCNISNQFKCIILNAFCLMVTAWVLFQSFIGYGPRALIVNGMNGYGATWKTILKPVDPVTPDLQKVISIEGATVSVPGSNFFKIEDILDPIKISKILLESQLPFYNYIRSQFSDTLLKRIASGELAEADSRKEIATRFNILLVGDKFNDLTSIDGLKIEVKTQNEIEKPERMDYRFTGPNRMLLQDAFEGYLNKKPMTYIEQVLVWNSELPATDRPHPYLQARGSDLRNGFRVTKPRPGYYLGIWPAEEIEKGTARWGIEHTFAR